jgi:hypothetical protein
LNKGFLGKEEYLRMAAALTVSAALFLQTAFLATTILVLTVAFGWAATLRARAAAARRPARAGARMRRFCNLGRQQACGNLVV